MAARPRSPPRSLGVSATARWTLSVAPSARQPWHLMDRNSSLCGTSKKFRWLLPSGGGAVEGVEFARRTFFFWLRKNRNGRARSPVFRSLQGDAAGFVTPVTLPESGIRAGVVESGRSACGPCGKGLPGCPAVWGGRVSPGSVHRSFFHRQNASGVSFKFLRSLFGVIKVTLPVTRNVLV